MTEVISLDKQENIIVEVSLHKIFGTFEVAQIYQSAVREWLEDNLPSYLWPDGFEYHIETITAYDVRKGPGDYA